MNPKLSCFKEEKKDRKGEDQPQKLELQGAAQKPGKTSRSGNLSAHGSHAPRKPPPQPSASRLPWAGNARTLVSCSLPPRAEPLERRSHGSARGPAHSASLPGLRSYTSLPLLGDTRYAPCCRPSLESDNCFPAATLVLGPRRPRTLSSQTKTSLRMLVSRPAAPQSLLLGSSSHPERLRYLGCHPRATPFQAL